MLLPYGIETPIRKPPWVTYILIGLNTVFFLFLLFTGTEKRDITFMQLGFIPDEWSRLSPLLSSIFLHGGWMHLIGNMYFLWIFGQAVEDKLGTKKYISFYLTAGIAANISHLLTVPNFFSDMPCVGASGAISGILGAFIVMAPHIRVKCFYFFLVVLRPILGTIELPSLLFLGGWFLIQLLYALSLSGVAGASGVAFWAHVGGFLFGMLVVGAPKIYKQSQNFITQLSWQRKFVSALKFAQKRDWSEARNILENLKASANDTGELDILLSQIYFQIGDKEKAKILANTAFNSAIRNKNHAQIITAYYTLQNIPSPYSSPQRGEEVLLPLSLLPSPQRGEEVLFPLSLLPSPHGGEGWVRGLEIPNQEQAHNYLMIGRSFAKYQKMKQAGDILEEALRKFPKGTETDLILYELGDIYLRIQNYERAKEIYTLFLKSYPNSKLYKSAEYCLRELQ